MHRCEPAVLDHEAMLGLGLRHIVEFVVAHLEDERVRARAGAGAAGRERGRERRGRGEAGAGLGAKGSVPARLRYAPWRLVCSRHAALRCAAPPGAPPPEDCEPRGPVTPDAHGAGGGAGAGEACLAATRLPPPPIWPPPLLLSPPLASAVPAALAGTPAVPLRATACRLPRLLHVPQDLLRELGINPVARRRLLPAMMRLFGRPHLWGQASNFFALLVEGCGEQAVTPSPACVPACLPACQEKAAPAFRPAAGAISRWLCRHPWLPCRPAAPPRRLPFRLLGARGGAARPVQRRLSGRWVGGWACMARAASPGGRHCPAGPLPGTCWGRG